jgi:hypothetical protein
MTRLDGLNRSVLTLVALLLGAAGVYGLLRGADAFGERAAEEPLLWDDLRRFVNDNAGWFWLVVAVAALLIAWLAWRWLRVQLLPTPSLDELPVGDRREGTTTLSAAAVNDAVRREVESHPNVSSSRVRMVGDPDEPVLDIRATVVDGGDHDAVRRWVEDEVLPHAREALEEPTLEATLRLRLGDAAQRVVA